MSSSWLDFLEWYLFQLIVLSKPDSNCFDSLMLSQVNKVTTGTQSFVLVIVNFGTWFAAVQLLEYVSRTCQPKSNFAIN